MITFFNKEKHPGRYYWLCYTLLFCLLAVLCFGYLWVSGKSFVTSGDGFNQHYKALLCFAKWMREIIRTLVYDHTLLLPKFSVHFGLGADFFTTLQYYVIGDPFALPAVFVPTKYMVYFYGFMVLFRLYLAGLAFMAFTKYMGKERNASLAGSLVYVFCAYSLYSPHPYFLNPMIYFPLLLLGVEKIRKEKKPWLFIFMVTVSAVSNFYFLYMLALLTGCYILFEAVIPWEKGKQKEKAGTVLKMIGYAFVGILLSAVMLLPIAQFFLSSMRREGGYTFQPFYPYSYYEKFLPGLITQDTPVFGSWTYLGVSAAAILAMFLLFTRKGKNRFRLKIVFCMMTAAFLLPFAGYISNGFSYVSNRWSWGAVFLFAYILTEMWPELLRLRKKDVVYLTVCLAAYFMISILLQKNVSKDFYFSVGLVAVVLAVFALRSISVRGNSLAYSRGTERFLFVIVVLGIGGMAYARFSPRADNYISEFKKAKGFQQETDATEAVAIKNVDNSDTFFRYSDSGDVIVSNGSVVSGVSNTHTYWSLVNSGVTDFYYRTLTSVKQIFNMKGFDARTMLEEICSTKYFVTKSADDKKVPYGYRPVSDTEVTKPDGSSVHYFVYENEYALPFGFTYDSYVTEEQAEAFTPLELQEAMMQTVVLDGRAPENGVAEVKKQEDSFSGLSFRNTEKNYEVKCESDGVTMQGNSFVVTGTDQKVTLTFSGMSECETYLSFQNLQFSGVSEYDLYNEDEAIDPLELYGKEEWEQLGQEKQKALERGNRRYVEPSMMNLAATAKHEDGSETVNKIIYQTPRYKWYNNRRDLLFNLCYADSPVTSIVIKFPKRGIYTFDSMDVYFQPFTDYADEAERLKEDVLENFDLHENDANVTDHITGTINLQKPKILFLSIPYSDGWRAFVDGKETDILKANYAFMALDLDAGEHEIELRYHTPGLKTGTGISCLGAAAVVFIVLFRRKKAFFRQENQR